MSRNSVGQYNQLNSVVAVSKPNDGTQQKASYRAFGGDKAGTGTAISRLKYTGREDDGSGLYQYRAQYYDPKMGRFISEDQLQFNGGINLYAYVENNPVNANDPSGNIPLPLVTGIVGGVIGGGVNVATQWYDKEFSNINLQEVGIATGTGFVAGALAPYTATTRLGAMALGSGSNVAQYWATQKVNNQPITMAGLGVSAVTGAAGGFVGGTVAKGTGLRFNESSSSIDSAFAKRLNSYADVSANLSGKQVGMNALGGAISGTPSDSVVNMLYSSKPSNNSISTVYKCR